MMLFRIVVLALPCAGLYWCCTVLCCSDHSVLHAPVSLPPGVQQGAHPALQAHARSAPSGQAPQPARSHIQGTYNIIKSSVIQHALWVCPVGTACGDL